ncbi:MAG: hypothetical protein IJ304_03180 [Clostridia bacterium]|nr:hypothetical protein [Clostridia bacterium]
MIIVASTGVLLPFILLACTFIFGGAFVGIHTIVDFFFKYKLYFMIASAVLLLIRTIVSTVNSYEKWSSFLYFVFELIRIPLTYFTLLWFANDWLIEAQNGGFFTFLIKAGVEGLFVLAFMGYAIAMPWLLFNDDVEEEYYWALPLGSMAITMIPLGLRLIVEYVNTGAWLPVELFTKLL